MIRAPVRVRVAATRISCKQCGREYKTGDLAVLTLCETCGSELGRASVSIETVQYVNGGKNRFFEDFPKENLGEEQLAARICVKRYVVQPGQCNASRASSWEGSRSRPLAAAWIKVG